MSSASPAPETPAGAPVINPGLKTLMYLMTWLLKFAAKSDDQPDLSGFSGVANLEVTGGVPYGWHIEIQQGRLQLKQGLHPHPQSVLRLSERTFVQLLEGRATFATALFTGRVRVEGDGHYNFILASIVTGFRKMATAQGRLGWLWRRVAAHILKRAAQPKPPEVSA